MRGEVPIPLERRRREGCRFGPGFGGGRSESLEDREDEGELVSVLEGVSVMFAGELEGGKE
jgi:hypothetical protein